ncbi:hypothetical protein [Desulfovirgula thermocuniculi]|uniref:hypothetical protein n=1 Tax=Desulfovirgula thermocuniculi TaxID=348842 RepID=UPI0004835A5C|nr:hypothetical protein [Desulfovirgula thermocuniculi]
MHDLLSLVSSRILKMVEYGVGERIESTDEPFGIPEGAPIYLPEHAVAAITRMEPHPEAVAAEGEEVLGTYRRMKSPGIITLYWERIGSLFWHHILSLLHSGWRIRRADLCALATVAVAKTYVHEVFHFFADICRHLFGSAYERDQEEALAVAASYRHICRTWLEGGVKHPVSKPLLGEFVSRIFTYTGPGYRDWHLYQSEHTFCRGIVDYLGPPAAGFLEGNGIDVASILLAVQDTVSQSAAVGAGVVTRLVPEAVMCYVIRQYREQDPVFDALWASIREGAVRQGWGISGTDLRQPLYQWVGNYISSAQRVWGETITEEEAAKRYSILKPLTEIAPGDLIVIPNMPRPDAFVLCRARAGSERSCYDFDTADEKYRGAMGDDFRHVVYIDPLSVMVVPYDADPAAITVKEGLKGYLKAVNVVRNPGFYSAVREVASNMWGVGWAEK